LEEGCKEIKKCKDELKEYKEIGDYKDKGRGKWDVIGDEDEYKVGGDKGKERMLKAQSEIESGNGKVKDRVV
uniref:hypothetical protein n=1 Tax=Bacillus subtilis TaxID=1423 RepID=UPI001642383F